MISTDPRYVALVDGTIVPSAAVWVRNHETLTDGSKVLVIFAASQARLYRLTDNHEGDPGRLRNAPVRFRVGPLQRVQASDHVIQSEHGLAVFAPIQSKVERAQWALERIRKDSLPDHLEAITELQQLICHRVLTHNLSLTPDRLKRFAQFQKQLVFALTIQPGIVWAKEALAIAKVLAFEI